MKHISLSFVGREKSFDGGDNEDNVMVCGIAIVVKSEVLIVSWTFVGHFGPFLLFSAF